jgi:PAS domain S-box-containing protein
VSASQLLEVLWEDGERVFCRVWRAGPCGTRQAALGVLPAEQHPSGSLDRLTREYGLRDCLDDTWALRPLELVHEYGRTMLVLAFPGGQPLEHLIGQPLELGRFLRLAIALSAAVGRLHERCLIHKDIKPANILVDPASERVWLLGFGFASHLPRERRSPEPPEFIEGTLSYMSPEQTGRMNRSIDSRSDLYSLGVTLYQMLTGSLPFSAVDPMEWIHCHIARRPVPPHERVNRVPIPLSTLIMKLLAKTAEERYQTAAGVEKDLRICLAEWDSRGGIDEFPLGEHDAPDRLLIPEKLYGRAREIDTLLASFDRVVASGRPELVLVSGYSGIGKSTVVHELHKRLVPPRGLFASGKCDQYKRDTPYSTLAQALQELIRPLLSKSEGQLSQWRDAIHAAVGANGRLMVELVPQLKLIIGEPPAVPDLAPQDAQRRFQLVLRRFIGVFAGPEHPLALFLDDLQWLDAATLDLLEDLLTQPDMQYLMLIGAYRDNEVDSNHPLLRKLTAIRQAGGAVREIVLVPLAREDLAQLLADSLHRQLECAAPLAQLVHEKTGGNPFFTIQFLHALAEEALLTFDHHHGQWSWDLQRIRATGYTDNVVELMVGKLNRLPVQTQDVLQRLACLGNSVEFAMLALLPPVGENSNGDIHAALQDAVRSGLVLRMEGSYRFLHDRVQEAAYSLIPEALRAAAHLKIGRLLAMHTPPEKREEEIFEIVNQLNRGSHLILSAGEREQVAELNLVAGRRAKASTAYASALKYLAAGRALLTAASSDDNYGLIFRVELLTAECELLTLDMVAAANRLATLARRARSRHEVAVVTRLRVTLYTALGRNERAVEILLEYLHSGGTEWSPRPTLDDARAECARVWSRLANRDIEELVGLPLMTNPEVLDVVDVLAESLNTALYWDENLSSLVIARIVNLSLEHGNSDGSCFAYVWFAVIVGPRFGRHEAGFRFGQLAYNLVEKRGLKRFQAGTYYCFGNVVLPWTKHARAGRDLIHRAFAAASSFGDVTNASASCDHLMKNLLVVGDPLDEVQREGERGLEYSQRVRYTRVVDHIKPQLGLVRTLRGLTAQFGTFDDAQFNELDFERHLASSPALAEPECWYWIRKLQARVLAGDYAAAVDASLNAQGRIATSPSKFMMLDPHETAEYYLFGALAHAACWDCASPERRPQHFATLVAHHRQLEQCAAHGPENFENRAALAAAEIARIEGRDVEAMRLYDRAIHSAHMNGFAHIEALANEVAARFYAGRGFEKIARTYLHDARHCYLRWGADGKVRQLDQLYPHLVESDPPPRSAGTILASVEQLDLATVIKVSQAVSGEIVFERLLDTLMRTAIEHAGAGRGLLILMRGEGYRIAAEATTSHDAVTVKLRQAAATGAELPESVLHYVGRTNESVLLHDAAIDSSFSADEYIQHHRAHSILCLPLLTQNSLVGFLYLENNLTAGVFTAARLPLLKLLASQAAISLENIGLYSDLREREAKVRRLVDSNIIGIFIWGADGRFIDTNEAFAHLVGYTRAELLSGRMSWSELTSAAWRDADDQHLAQLRATGRAQPYEKEYLHKSGHSVPVLVGAANFEGGPDAGVAFVVDLTDRKNAERAVHESELRYREVEMALAHANRVATVGQLSASIAHEVNQPIGAAVTSAYAALRWLAASPPDMEEVQLALSRIVKSGNRAADIIGRIRALIKKSPLRKDSLEVNEAIREVIALTHGEVVKNSVSVRTRLSEHLPRVRGDRVQLQQVALNLMINAVEAMSGVDEGSRALLITSAAAKSGDVLVEVRDTGPGLDAASLERVFEAFYTTKPGGLGMGLSVCRSIIEAHGGRLWATAGLPKGAIFHFTLPADCG